MLYSWEKMEKTALEMLKEAKTPGIKDHMMKVKYREVDDNLDMGESATECLKALKTNAANREHKTNLPLAVD